MQQKYATSPVVFLLFPCNSFLFQEPHANSVIKTFAEKYLNLTMGNVFMFAKSDVNKACTSGGGCKPSSTACCPDNNDVYSYLRSVINHKVTWNFNKYLLDHQGVPTVRYDDDVYADKLEPAIDQLLAPSFAG